MYCPAGMGLSELALSREMRGVAAKNRVYRSIFRGAGAYNHYIPAVVGAVTSKEISDGLKAQYGLDVGKSKIVQEEPIKAFGTYQVKAKLGYEVTGIVNVVVVEA